MCCEKQGKYLSSEVIVNKAKDQIRMRNVRADLEGIVSFIQDFSTIAYTIELFKLN